MGKPTVQRSVLTRDRSDPERDLPVVCIDSYQSAMENFSLPETAQFAENQRSLLDG